MFLQISQNPQENTCARVYFLIKLQVVVIFSVKISLADVINPLSAKLTKWPNTLKQFVGNLPTSCLSVFGHFVGLALNLAFQLETIVWNAFGLENVSTIVKRMLNTVSKFLSVLLNLKVH